MTTAAIDVVDVSKVFRIWNHPRDMLVEILTGRVRHTNFQALDRVNCSIPRGAIVGIMGRNGAGKSTLLRIVAGTLDATSGRVDINGRISSILELGTGFHPEYTGRENIRLGGLCLGLSEKEVQARTDEIIDFSELREFIDQPFRTYSSGMQARLTFAVATSIDPDILIIDEALSVGDARFSLKSFDRIRNFKKQGKSILLVSHDINAVNALCDEAILLERGVLHARGTPVDVGNVYHELLFGKATASAAATRAAPDVAATSPDQPAAGKSADSGVIVDAKPQVVTNGRLVRGRRIRMMRLTAAARRNGHATAASLFDAQTDSPPSAEETDSLSEREHRYGDGAARIVSIEFRNMEDRPVSRLDSGATYDLVCRVNAERDVEDLCFGFIVRDNRGTDIFGWDSRCGGVEIARPDMRSPPLQAGRTAEARVRFRNNLAGGTYFLTVAIARADGHKVDLRFDAVEFLVRPTATIFSASVLNLEVRPGAIGPSSAAATLWDIR